jgi:hypothetical protein
MIDTTKCENCGKRVLCGCASKHEPRPDLLELAHRSLAALREDKRDIHHGENIPRLEAAIAAEKEYREAVKELVGAVEAWSAKSDDDDEKGQERSDRIEKALARLRGLVE